ncbi:MAG: cytochrome P450 [Bacteriovorax sp.]|jgi:cytochrome P450
MLFPFSIYSFLTDPVAYLTELQKKYGDPFPLSFPGAPTIWLTAKPDLVKTIFTAPADSFMPSEHNPVGPLLGNEGLLMLSGNTHLLRRKEFTPSFSKNNLMSSAAGIHKIFSKIYDKKALTGVLNLQEFAFESTLKIILKFLFPHINEQELSEAKLLTEKFLKSYSASFLFIPKWVPGTWGNFVQRKTLLDDRFYEFFLRGIECSAESPLARLKEAPKEEVMDHIRTFIVAGHETSATSLVWALYHIHRDIHIKNRLAEELNIFSKNSEENFIEVLLQNKFLDCVVSEALRIEPPVPFVTRKIINRDFKLGDRIFSIDEEIGVCITLLHRQDSTWNHPAEFSPDRFLTNKYSPYEYAPFGGGTRRCIGAELSILELKILIGCFLKHFDASMLMSPAPSSEVLQITIGPKKPVKLLYTKHFV